MTETEITIEDSIDSLIAEIEEKNSIIESLYVEHKDIRKDCSVMSKKIIKLKSTLNICELEFEYDDTLIFLQDKLNAILNSENTIIQVINDDGIENGEITQRFNSIRIYISELEQKLFQIIDLSIPHGSSLEIRNHIKNYKQQLTLASREITNKMQTLNDDIKLKNDEIKNAQVDIESKNIELNNKIENLDTNVSNKINEYTELFENNKNNIDTEINDIITECKAEIESKKKEISDIKSDYEEKLKNIELLYNQKFNELSEQSLDKFNELQKDIESKDTKISKLIGLIGNKVNIGEYKSNADRAHKERMIWQYITVGIFLLAFILMIVITFFTKDYNASTLARYIVSVILLGMSGYTAKQAGNQRKDEVYFRKQQLELSSIDVYLDDMPEDIKQNIKKELSNKIFGQANETYKNKYDDSASNTIDKITKMVDNIVNSLKK